MSEREMPGSAFENFSEGDDRTWDEKGVGRELWSDDDDDRPTDDEPTEPDDAVIGGIWAEAAWIERELEAAENRTDVMSFNPEDPTVDELVRRLDYLEAEMDLWGYPPLGWKPPAGWRPPVLTAPDVIPDGRQPTKGNEFDDELAKVLSARELQHLGWLVDRRRQVDISRDLGISQVAVSKREKALRAKIDQLHIDFDGRPYPWLPFQSGHGGRSRKV
jgi:hypothetical protein